MRPIKQLQQATHFKKMIKKDLVQELKDQSQNFEVDSEDEEDLTGSIWLPVINDKDKEEDEENYDQNVKEMDLAEISEKEVFVRKADLVRTHFT